MWYVFVLGEKNCNLKLVRRKATMDEELQKMRIGMRAEIRAFKLIKEISVAIYFII